MSSLTTSETPSTIETSSSTIETTSLTETTSSVVSSSSSQAPSSPLPSPPSSTMSSLPPSTSELPPSSTTQPPSTSEQPPTSTSQPPTTSQAPPTTTSEAPPPVTTTSTTSNAGPVTPTTSTTSTQGAPPSTTSVPSSSTSTVVFSTVIVTTDQNGQVETQTVRSTQLIFPTQSQSSGGGSTSSTAAIAGGVVGGALGLLAVIMIIFFILRRRKQKDEFDGNFDPDRLDPERFGGSATRPGAMPDVDLVGAEVTPFQYQPEAAQQKGYGQYQQMAQRPGMLPPVVSGGSVHGRSDAYSSTTGSHYPTTVTDHSVAGMQNADFRGPSPGPSLGTSGTFLSSKERELASERRRLHIANEERGEGGSGSGGVVQHRDGGRLQEENVPEEVPPSYDSISPDGDDAAGRS